MHVHETPTTTSAGRRIIDAPPGANPVKVARGHAGLSQAELAVKASVSLSTLQLAERGLLSTTIAERLAAALGVPATALLTR